MSYPAKILYASGAIEKKLYDEALEELRKAKILAGSQKEMIVQVLTMEADIYYRKGDYEKSFALFKEAVSNNPEDLILLNNYSYYLAEQNQDIKEAERMIKKVVEKENENTTFLDTYAWVLFKGGKTREAIKVMEDIMKRDSKPDADWYEHYGYMMKEVKKCDVAVLYWQKSLELEPERKELINAIKTCKK
jgi:pentatricopeptide repeat protein